MTNKNLEGKIGKIGEKLVDLAFIGFSCGKFAGKAIAPSVLGIALISSFTKYIAPEFILPDKIKEVEHAIYLTLGFFTGNRYLEFVRDAYEEMIGELRG